MVQHTSQYKFAYQACVAYAFKRWGDDAKVLTIAGMGTDSRVGAELKRQSLQKDGTWKLHELGNNSTTYAYKRGAPGISYDAASDKNTYIEKPTRTDFSNSPEMRRKLSLKPLEKQAWFRKKFSRQQVIEVLEDALPGTFLVRESSQVGLYAISIQQGGHISNVLCIPEMRKGQTMYKFGDKGDVLFHTIAEMVEYFKKNPYTQSEATGDLLILGDAPGMMKKKASVDAIAEEPEEDFGEADGFGGTGLEHLAGRFGSDKNASLC